MNKKTLLFIFVGAAAIVMTVSSCKKTIINNYYCDCDKDSCTTTPPDTCKDLVAKWRGAYSTLGGLEQWLGDSSFIGGGMAKLVSKNSPWSYFWTTIDLPVPQCRNYSADSIKLEARVKNPLAEGAVEELDLAVLIGGTNDTAIVNYIGRQFRQEFTSLGIWHNSNYTVSNVPELVQLFQDWTTVSLEVKNGVISTYRDGVFIKSINIGSMKLGKLNYISVVFKGTGSIDWIKATDNNGNLKIREEFNTDNKSTVEFF